MKGQVHSMSPLGEGNIILDMSKDKKGVGRPLGDPKKSRRATSAKRGEEGGRGSSGVLS